MNEERDDRLTAAARQLATEIRPQRDLWPERERAITEPAPQRSRWTPMFAQAAAVVAVAACGSGVKLPPVSPDQVEVFMPGVPISEEYKVMARLEEAFSMDTQDSAVIEAIRERAAELGADA